MALRALQTIPVLRIFDEEKAREFYVGFLGFSVDWEHRFDDRAPVYMQVSLGGLVLHLSGHHGDGCPGSTVFVRVTGLDDFHREIMATGYGFMRPGIEHTAHGSRCIQVIDPFGNRLRFDEALAQAGASPATSREATAPGALAKEEAHRPVAADAAPLRGVGDAAPLPGAKDEALRPVAGDAASGTSGVRP